MKGIELPINTLIILALAVIVLIVVLFFFLGVWRPGISTVSVEAAKNNACQTLVSLGCVDPTIVTINNFDANNNGRNDATSGWDFDGNAGGDNLGALCDNYYFKNDINSCKELCGCA